MTLRIGSVCTGYGGLDTAVQQVFGGELAWVSDIDPGACQIIAHHHPTVPNLGDITTLDWRTVEPVDIYIGGYPCQPFSLAGDLKGTEDERHLWPFIAGALRVLRPRIAIFENVANHLRLGFDTVLCDLADLGFDAEWVVVRADEVGAPHQRRRLFVFATASDADRPGLEGRGLRRAAPERSGPAADAYDLGSNGNRPCSGLRDEPAAHGLTAPDTEGDAVRQQPVPELGGGPATVVESACSDAASDTGGRGLHGHRELPAGRDTVQRGVRDDAPRCDAAATPNADRGGRGADERDVQPGQPNAAWGRFAPAIARWEAVTGRRAPWATDDRHRLSPAFVEWMMGLPAGHVTAVPGLTRTQQLKALGNGVVPQQAAAAIRLLAERAGALEAAA